MENIGTDNLNTPERQAPVGEFTGMVSLQLADLIQMVCLSRWDLIVRVTSAQGKGTIQIREGRIDHAQTDSLQGDQAFFEMFRWTDGQFEMLPYRATSQNSVGKPWEHLLLEAMRQRDEALSREAGGSEDRHDDADPPLEGSFDFGDGFEHLGMGEEFLSDPPGLEASAELELEPLSDSALKVLVVEDSPFFARQLKKALETDPDIQVIAIAKNGQEALDILSSSASVDVVTLDVEMPVMPGGTALKHIMIRHRIPALVISAFQPNAMSQIFEYMELGAVDFISKPSAGEDIEVFGQRLRDLARNASTAALTHFRRLRRGGTAGASGGSVKTQGAGSGNILLVLGAEGAYVDWLRMPWSQLCRDGIVIGLQKLPRPFLDQFCRLIQKRTSVPTVAAMGAIRLERGSLYLGNGGCPVSLTFDESGGLEIEEATSKEIPWGEGVHSWIQQLAELGRHRLNILCLSAAHQLPPELVEHVFNSESRLILPPRDSIMLPQLQDGIHPYAHVMPRQVVVSAPENLLEVFAGNE